MIENKDDNYKNKNMHPGTFLLMITRPDTQLPQSRAGGRGPYLRSVEHLGRSSKAKNLINTEKVKA